MITVIRAQLSGLANGAFGESQPLGVSASSGARLSGTTVVKADNLSNGLGGLVGGSVQSQQTLLIHRMPFGGNRDASRT